MKFDPTCAFCAIARGADDSANVVCESATWIAFFPLAPATPGHTVVIPRGHAHDLWELDDVVSREVMTAVLRVGRAIQEAVHPEGMNLISSSGSAAEQTVFHAHLHVVPRWSTDRIDRIWPPKHRMDETLKDDVAARIREACRA